MGYIALRRELRSAIASVFASRNVATMVQVNHREFWVSYCCACACDISLVNVVPGCDTMQLFQTHHNARLVICHRGVVGVSAVGRSLVLVGPLEQRVWCMTSRLRHDCSRPARTGSL